MHYNRFVLYFIFCFVINVNLKAQNFDAVISEKFDTEIFDFGRLSDGKWIFAVKISPLPDALALPDALEDISLAVIITDSLGVQIKTIPVPFIFTEERYEIRDLFILPNDEFIVMDVGGDCDSDLSEGALQKLDTTGKVLWSFHVGTYASFNTSGTTPDGNIIGFYDKWIYGNWIRSISSLTGTTLWESNLDSIPFRSILIMPGTDNLLVGDEEGLKIYKKHTSGSDIKYILNQSQDIAMNSGFITQMVSAGDGLFYALKSDTREIIRFRDDLIPEVILTCPANTAFFPKPNGLGLASYKFGIIQEYLIYDTLWVKKDSIKIDWPGVKPRLYGAFDDGLALVGKYTSGANTPDYPDDLYYSGRRQGWFDFYKDYHLKETDEIFSLSIKEMIEEDSIIIDSFYSPGPDYDGYLYSFSGGNYKLKIVNTGNQPVDSFWVNTVFNYLTNYWWCSPASATQRKYIIPKLFPGDSTWVEFGDFDAILQRVLPVNFCFWTSGPNQHPDFIPEDDLYCLNSGLHHYYPEKIWTEATYTGGNGWHTRKNAFDTNPVTLDGKVYRRLKNTFSENSTSWLLRNIYLREQSGKIYMYHAEGEQILYDFNLMQGDTFHFGTVDLVHDFIVNKVDTIHLINDDYRRRYYLEAINPIDENSDANHVIWIEDIGNINGLMTNSNPWTEGWNTSTMLCMYWDSTLVYDDPDQDVCWLMTTSTNEIDNEKIYFIPNPAAEEITLMGYESDLEEIKIFNTNGQLIFTGMNNAINISDLPAGYYYATIRLKNSRLRNLGFVKM
ncbi:MAG TPA: T9SS type A sorting domain-containing protein [Saprospiraceae bacterium]|nr:T9SS type A sorting domain-containing protein [Saprospiraceae bacterium]